MLAEKRAAPSPAQHLARAILLKSALGDLLSEICTGERRWDSQAIENLTDLGSMYREEIEAAVAGAK